VEDDIIKRFDLEHVYEVDYISQARKKLEQKTNIISGRDGIINIEVDDKDPKRAADMANAYVDELFKLTSVLAVTEASQRRLFFERQLVQAKDNLVKTELSARQALDKGGLVKVDDQGRAMVETTARLRAQIAAKEVQIDAMRAFAADGNPDLLMAQRQLEAMKREAEKIEGKGSIELLQGVSTGKGIDNLSLLRDMKYYETLYELLAKQFELAKIDEAKDSSVMQVMDPAIVPDRESKPKRWLIVLIAAVTGLFTAFFVVLSMESLDKARNNPMKARQIEAFRKYLAWH
jgi:uncharacterized protein involved in exopolysaccharide biosynthesis